MAFTTRDWIAIPGVGPFIAAGSIMAARAGFGVSGAAGGLIGVYFRSNDSASSSSICDANWVSDPDFAVTEDEVVAYVRFTYGHLRADKPPGKGTNQVPPKHKIKEPRMKYLIAWGLGVPGVLCFWLTTAICE